MRNLLLGVMIGVVAVLLGAYLFLTRGMPVATKGGPPPLERFLASTALHHAMNGEVDTPAPMAPDEANLLAGAKVYRAQCEVCHGLLHQPPSAIASGMFPRPPQLLVPGKGVTDDPVGETHWKVKNGIRLSGMPGFTDALSDAEMWQVSLLLLKADQLPNRVQQALRP